MPERLFYDGHCGLCHGAVRFVLARDRAGALFRFAPLGGETFLKEIPAGERQSLPDSIVVVTREGRLLVRWRAACHILIRLGGAWGLCGKTLGAIPPALGDRFYDFVARSRHRFFKRPAETCPAASARLRQRFDP